MEKKKKGKKSSKSTKKATKPIQKATKKTPTKAIGPVIDNNIKKSYDELLSQLPDKYARFVQEYLIDLNKEKAAERVGYAKGSARSTVSRMLRNATVVAAINEGKKLIASRAMVNQDEVLKELALIGFADMADFIKVDEGGGVYAIPLEQLKPGTSRIIKKIKEKRIIKSCQGSKDKPSEDMILESTYEFELHDKVKSLLGILDRVKPGADDPQKVEMTLTNMPREFKSIKEWEIAYKAMMQKVKESK